MQLTQTIGQTLLKQNPESFKAMRANPKLAGFVNEDWKLNQEFRS
ncbi:hypothetical protein [Candidatus Tisiphia endosymbiont of Parasteatoda lunata]